MASVYYDFTTFENDVAFSDEIVTVDGIIRLRKTDEATGIVFDGSGTFKEGTALLPNLVFKDVIEFVGFETEEIYNLDTDGDRLGEIKYQVSKDDGTTFLYHDGTSWVVATLPTHFNTKEEVDEFITDLTPFPERRIKFNIRITPSTDGKFSPLLVNILLHYQVRTDFIEDFKRSIKRYLDSNLSVRITDRIEMPATSVTVTLFDTSFSINTVFSVFNLTTDPGRIINLFSSLAGSTITMTGSQTAGDVIAVNYEGDAPVFLAADEDFQFTQVPAFVVEIPTIIENKELRSGDRKLDRQNSKLIVRERLQRLFNDVTVIVSCIDKRETGSIRMAQELARVLQYQKSFASEGTGADFTILDFQPLTADDRVSVGLFVKQITITVSGKVFQEDFTEKKLVKEVKVFTSNTSFEGKEEF